MTDYSRLLQTPDLEQTDRKLERTLKGAIPAAQKTAKNLAKNLEKRFESINEAIAPTENELGFAQDSLQNGKTVNEVQADLKENGRFDAINEKFGAKHAQRYLDGVTDKAQNAIQAQKAIEKDPNQTPAEQDTAIAKEAFSRNETLDKIGDLVRESEEFDNIKQLYGEEEAEKYVDLVTNDAARQQFIEEHPELEQSNEISQEKEQEL